MEKIHPIYQNDTGNRFIKDDQLQRSASPIQRPTRRRNKRVFIWAVGQAALTEMTKTVKEREPNSLPLYRLYALFRLHFIPERNKHHSRADFFNLKREPGESAAETWKRILEIEKTANLKK